jgi:hypothetical protein
VFQHRKQTVHGGDHAFCTGRFRNSSIKYKWNNFATIVAGYTVLVQQRFQINIVNMMLTLSFVLMMMVTKRILLVIETPRREACKLDDARWSKDFV